MIDNYLNKIQYEWGGIDVKKEKAKPGYAIAIKASELDHKEDRKCQAERNSDSVKCRCKGLKAATTYLKNNIGRCKGDVKCISAIRKYMQNNIALIKHHCSKNV